MLDPITLEDVIKGCKRNDRRSQRILYEAYYKRFMSITTSYIKDYGEAENCLNHAFLRIFKKVGLYTHFGSFEGWMRTIIIREALNYIKQNEKNKRRVSYYEELEKVDNVPADSQLMVNDIQKIILSLPRRTREVFTDYLDGKSHKEIGKIRGINEGTSKWHVSEARVAMKRKLKLLGI